MRFSKRQVPEGLRVFADLPVTALAVGPASETMAVCVLGDRDSGRTPLICVPGYHRNMADWADFVRQLHRALGEEWPVVLLDLKGRGRSADRADRRLYLTTSDAADLMQVAAALVIEEAILVGQGYGGQVIMALGALAPSLVGGTLLLDAGPVSDPRGLVRLRNNLRDIEGRRSEAGYRAMFRRILTADYPGLPDSLLDTLAARTHYLDARGRVQPLFDPHLVKVLDQFEHDDILVPQWGYFGALAHAPMLLMRTQLTDQLRRDTFEEMLRRRTDAEGYIIEGQGSPALLNTPEDVEPVAAFLRRLSGKRRRAA